MPQLDLNWQPLHNPPVVYLDEPTIGLNVSVKAKIRSFIKEMNHLYHTTVILTTHDMQDIEEICKRIIIIDEGKVLYDGDLHTIQSQFGHKRVIHFELELHSSSFTLPSQLQEKVEVTQPDPTEPGKVSISFNQNEWSAADVISAMLSMYKVKDLTITDPKIETIVKEIYDKGITNHAQILGDSKVPNPT